MFVFEVAVPCPIYRNFYYFFSSMILNGSRVKVSFNHKIVLGLVIRHIPDFIPQEARAYLEIQTQVDQTPFLPETMQALAKWLAAYYVCPIGEVYGVILSGSFAKKKKISYVRSKKKLPKELAFLEQFFSKKEHVSQKEIEKELKQQKEDFTLKDFLEKNVIKKIVLVEEIPFIPDLSHEQKPKTWQIASDLTPFVLSDDQVAALNKINIHDPLFFHRHQTYLIHGVTGSGKTELYLQIIEHLKNQEDPSFQVLILVPEISLTPQVTMLFEKRFPDLVAVVHSKMTPKKKWKEKESIRTGQKKILIGPRSAVFGVFQNLRLVIVDEEHDTSYKQDHGLCYHGRDTAIYRGYIENCPVILGSATPSLESYERALSGKYLYVSMTTRATGRPLPYIHVIEKSSPKKNQHQPMKISEGVILEDNVPMFSSEVLLAIKETLERKEQVMVMINRRGFSHYVMNLATKEVVQCYQCAVSLTFHKNWLKCHYCDYTISLRDFLKTHPHSYGAMGLGTQKAEEGLKKEFPNARIQRLDSDNVSQTQGYLEETLEQFRNQNIDILVGTQMLAKGHDFSQVTLMVLLDIDKSLYMPDFRSGERTFQLLVQAAGRPGRGEKSGHVFLETTQADHPILIQGLTHDYKNFAHKELMFRKEYHYPPFYKLVLIECSALMIHESKLLEFCSKIERWALYLKSVRPELGVKITGPSVPAISYLKNRHRRTLLIQGPDHQKNKPVVSSFLQHIHPLPWYIRLTINVDPQDFF